MPVIRLFLIFAATFAVGLVVALAVRTALYRPAEAGGSPFPAAASASPVDSGSAVSRPGVWPAPVVAAASAETRPVNTVCAICGMNVDPSLPTELYQGKVIGFGCRMCPAKFRSDPDKYGPYYLRNEVIKR